jgi:hypothetical protein
MSKVFIAELVYGVKVVASVHYICGVHLPNLKMVNSSVCTLIFVEVNNFDWFINNI